MVEGEAHLGQPAVYNKLCRVHKGARIAGQEQRSSGRLYALPEPPLWQMHLSPLPLAHPQRPRRRAVVLEADMMILVTPSVIGIQKVLQHLAVQRAGAETVEPDPLARVHDAQLARHADHGALARRVRKLRRGAPDQRRDRADIDDAPAARLGVAAHAQHAVLATQPGTHDVDAVGGVPGVAVRHQRVAVLEAREVARAVDHDIDAAELVELAKEGLDLSLVRHVGGVEEEPGFRKGRVQTEGLVQRLEGGWGNVGQEKGLSLRLRKEDRDLGA